MAEGSGPYFYLPKLESHLEARLWNDVFKLAQDTLGVPRGTIKATVLIETILAASRWMRSSTSCKDHIVGTQLRALGLHLQLHQEVSRTDPSSCCPTGRSVGMDRHFLRSYTQLVVKTCHRRGAPTPWAEWRPRFPSRTIRPPTRPRWTK